MSEHKRHPYKILDEILQYLYYNPYKSFSFEEICLKTGQHQNYEYKFHVQRNPTIEENPQLKTALDYLVKYEYLFYDEKSISWGITFLGMAKFKYDPFGNTPNNLHWEKRIAKKNTWLLIGSLIISLLSTIIALIALLKP